MNPNFFFNNSTFSYQLQYIAGHSLELTFIGYKQTTDKQKDKPDLYIDRRWNPCLGERSEGSSLQYLFDSPERNKIPQRHCPPSKKFIEFRMLFLHLQLSE